MFLLLDFYFVTFTNFELMALQLLPLTKYIRFVIKNHYQYWVTL